jgi:hypothetical protein
MDFDNLHDNNGKDNSSGQLPTAYSGPKAKFLVDRPDCYISLQDDVIKALEGLPDPSKDQFHQVYHYRRQSREKNGR